MSCINQYIFEDNSDCETVYSYEEQEIDKENEEEEYQEENEGEYYDEYEDEYQEPEYITVKKEVIEPRKKMNMKILEVNPWNKNKEETIKTMAEILKEEEENKKKEDIKKKEIEKLSKQRKERFRHSRSKFHFKNETEGTKKFLLKK